MEPSAKDPFRVAVIGNPNSGKSSIFNLLTGLQQKVGNFPGVTVERKTGHLIFPDGKSIELIDLPGTYSVYPTSEDERLVVQTLTDTQNRDYPDAVLYIADVTRLEKHLLLLTQVKDMGFTVILALNMSDTARAEGLEINLERLARKLGVEAVAVSGRTSEGIEQLKQVLAVLSQQPPIGTSEHSVYRLSSEEARLATELQDSFPSLTAYQRILLAHHADWLPHLSPPARAEVMKAKERTGFRDLALQVRETMQRFDFFTPVVQQNIRKTRERPTSNTERLDILLTHRLVGPAIFFLLMLFVFQAIFTLASYPMDWIEAGISALSGWTKSVLPPGWLAGLIGDGLLAGLGGVLVFIPQIAILFFLIALLEEVGYMARAAFMFDRLMQAFGLNGRSIVALISGGACAIPAIMSTRTISNWKERLITILVTPFISCSARIPVYTVLIAFVVPEKTVLGFFTLQGLAFMGLYLLGIAAALLSALVFKWILRSGGTSYLMLELPPYRPPLMRNVWITVLEKVRSFTLEAGKVILVISMALWVLASYGPPEAMKNAQKQAEQIAREKAFTQEETGALAASMKMEASFAGMAGKWIEPVIRPLGFDWKIGIALITSFAAREVFVGTMATIYSLSDSDDPLLIRQRMAMERNPLTGKKVYDPPTTWALLLFYVFAMQCMSTLAVVRRETLSWKWPLIQFFFMTGLAYLSAWAVATAL